jgi:hypothetical protein
MRGIRGGKKRKVWSRILIVTIGVISNGISLPIPIVMLRSLAEAHSNLFLTHLFIYLFHPTRSASIWKILASDSLGSSQVKITIAGLATNIH